MPDRSATRRGFTLIEGLMASALFLTLATMFWGFFSRTTDAQARMAEVMKVMDATALQARMDEDIRTSIEVVEPEELASGERLSFFDREYRRVTYELRPMAGGSGLEIVRTAAGEPAPLVLASGINRGIFYRMGPRLVGYLLDFQPQQRPGAAPGAKPVDISLTSKVYLNNGIY